MARSFHYASRSALTERSEAELEHLEPRAEAWEALNRGAFMDGYRRVTGIDGLLPSDDDIAARVLTAYELDKALYELDYERAYRPDWVAIPSAAVVRMLVGSGDRRRPG
jgi:maltokinase